MTSTNGNLKKHNIITKDLLSEEQQDVLEKKENKIEKLQAEINQLSKPLLQSESSWSKHITPGILSVFQDDKHWDEINLDINKRDVKELKQVDGQSWIQLKESMHLESEDDSFSESGSPITTQLDIKDMSIFGTMPMEEDMVVVKCNHCQRPLLPSKFKEHSETCLGNKKKLDFFSDDEDMDTKKDLKKKKKAVVLEDELNSPVTTAKRPPSTSLEKTEKKKIKKEKQQKKTTKQKAPLDLDKQCGVIQGPNNLPCTRSLTCKSHSMGAKRAVEGRSQPYDVLLAAYQKKSIGRPNVKDQLAKKKVESTFNHGNTANTITATNTTTTAGKSIKSLKKLQSQLQQQYLNSADSKLLIVNQTNDESFIDSDEEVENVMQAFKQSRPTPLAEKRYYFVKRRRQCFRLRDILVDAITPKLNNTYSQRQQQQQQQQQQQNNFNTDNNTIFNEPSNTTFFSVR